MSSAQEPAPGSYPVGADLVGERLDLALVRLLGGISRTRLQELIKDGGVRVAGEVERRPGRILEAPTDLEVLDVPRTRERRGAPAGAHFEVLFEDEHLAVITKPPGMVAHPSTVVRGATVSELAAERWGALPSLQGEDRPGIVHRLDGETSGVMVLALSVPAAQGLIAAFKAREVEKSYLALVHGEPRFDSDWIDAPIGRSRERSDRMSVCAPGEGRDAQTFYETLERLVGFALVRCKPKTGRTHQLRVHLSSIDHPLVGDRVYRGRRGEKLSVARGLPRLGRHALHAESLAFRHPVSGAPLSFEAPLWPDLADWLEALRKRARERADER